MSSEEKSAWIMGVVAIAGYATYVAIVLGAAQGRTLTEVEYVAPLLWTVGGAILASILAHIVVGVGSPSNAGKKDQRDREIYRLGEYTGQAFLVIGGVSALLMAMAELDYFWIANAVYLCFVLSAILSTITKVILYRRGLPQW